MKQSTRTLFEGTQDTWVRSRGQKVLLEKEMATHCSIPAWRIPWTKEHGQSIPPKESHGSPWSHKELDTTECLNTHTIGV